MKLSSFARHCFIAISSTAFLFAAPIVTRVTDAAPSAMPQSGVVPIASTFVNLGKTLYFRGWMRSTNRYDRMESVVILSGKKAKLTASTCNFAAGGVDIPFGIDTPLTLTLDGTIVAIAAVKASDVEVTFDVDLTGIAEGWYMASVTGLDSSWSVLDYGVYVLKDKTAQPHSLMPVTTASHELLFAGDGRYQQAWVPTKFEPVSRPSSAAMRRPNSGCELSPVPTAVPPIASSRRSGSVAFTRSIEWCTCDA